ncbi:MAG: hypothetical protein NVS3B2_17040 [Ramlibacter sp.]
MFDPARHERIKSRPWDEREVRAAIGRIVDDSLGAVAPDELWPAHQLDEPTAPGTTYSMLYMGAGGVIWALRHLAQLGYLDPARVRFDPVIPTLVARNRAVGETQLGGTASFLMGDSGLLLLQWQTQRDAVTADRLYEAVLGNLHHPARESLWGSPGTMLASLHMAHASGEGRWAELFERGARVLFEQMLFDDGLGAWVWHQDLYGRTRCFLGAGHGFAGNVYPILRGANFLPEDLVAAFTDRAWQTLDLLAIRSDGCVNWHAVHDPATIAGRLPITQDCHGAPGIVVRLASAPKTSGWNQLLEQAGELTWRAGPLRKGASLCHGTAGNGFCFLKLWTRTADPKWLDRARAFAMHAIGQVDGERAARGHGRHSLWTGDVGVALYLANCLTLESNFPTLDVF